MDSIDICVCDQQDRWVDDLGTSLCFSCMGLYLMERYQYRPFDSETEIRLVSLFPGRHGDDLFCEIIHTNLNERPTYEAISYTWGDPALSERVLCRNTGVLAITKNCGAALRDLRLETERRLLWIDAICINQYDKDERGHQVKLMQRVYACAQQVLIHLASSATDEIAFAMDSLPKLTVEDPVVVQPGLTSLVSLPWFSRVWVLQEVASAKEAWIVIGNRKANWKLLSLGRLVQAGLFAMNNAGSIPAVLRLSDGNDKPFPDLMSLINTGRSCLSSDPRDKIFALLGLLRRRGSFDIQPDYHESVGEIYLKVTKKIIETANNLDVLSEVAREAKWQREASESIEGLKKGMETSRFLANELKRKIAEAENPQFPNSLGDLSWHALRTYGLSSFHPERDSYPFTLAFISRPLVSLVSLRHWNSFGNGLLLLRCPRGFYPVERRSRLHFLVQSLHYYTKEHHATTQDLELYVDAPLSSRKRRPIYKDRLAGGEFQGWEGYESSVSELRPFETESHDDWVDYFSAGYADRAPKSTQFLPTLSDDYAVQDWWKSERGMSEFDSRFQELCSETVNHEYPLSAWIREKRGSVRYRIIANLGSFYEIRTGEGMPPRLIRVGTRETFYAVNTFPKALRIPGTINSEPQSRDANLQTGIDQCRRPAFSSLDEDILSITGDPDERRSTFTGGGSEDEEVLLMDGDISSIRSFFRSTRPEKSLIMIIFTISILLAQIRTELQEPEERRRQLDELKALKAEAERTAKEVELSQKFVRLADGFLLSHNWMVGHSATSSEDPSAGEVSIPSWVPDLRRPAHFSTLDVSRPNTQYNGPLSIAISRRNSSNPSASLNIRILEVETFSPQQAENKQPDFYPDLLNATQEKISRCIRLVSPDIFWEDMQQNLGETDYGVNLESVRGFSYGRKLGKTQSSFTLCPFGSRLTDIICLIYGSCVPFVLRPTGSKADGEFQLVGECYLHGLRSPRSLGSSWDYLKLLGAFSSKIEANSTEGLPWKAALLV